MSETRTPPPDRHEGADTLIQWTLTEATQIRIDAAKAVEQLEWDLDTAKAFHHEAVMAERALDLLIRGTIYRGGTVMGQDFDVDRLDAEVCPNAAVPHIAPPAPIERPEPFVAVPRLSLAHLGAAWATFPTEPLPPALTEQLSPVAKDALRAEEPDPRTICPVCGGSKGVTSHQCITCYQKAHDEPRQAAPVTMPGPKVIALLSDKRRAAVALEHGLTPPKVASRPQGRIALPPEERQDFKDAQILRGRLGELWAAHPTLINSVIAKGLGISNARAYSAVKILAGEGVVVIHKTKTAQGVPINHILRPTNGAQVEPPASLPEHKVAKARKMMAEQGYNLTMVAGMLDVSKRDLHAALNPTVAH